MTFDEWLAKTGAHPSENIVTAMRDAWNAALSTLSDKRISARVEAARRVNDALDVLEPASSSGGKGPMFSYRGTHLTYEDVRELAAFVLPEVGAITLLRAWVAGCGDPQFSSKKDCEELLKASGDFLSKLGTV